jgi:hypothetical protein
VVSVIVAEKVRAQITSFDIDPAATRQLARIYYGRVAERLWKNRQADGERAGESEPWHEVEGLHPRLVYAARTGEGSDPGFDLAAAVANKDVILSNSIPPPVRHVPDGEVEPWVRESVAALERNVKEVDSTQTLRLSEELAHASRDTVDDAAVILRRVWPEAAEEFATLIRSIIYVEAQGFGSASLQKTFGAIYTSADYVGDAPAAFEMLLHETGHHALYLRNSFARFVTNGSDIATHALRSDARPIAGVMHSTHASARMAVGLARWARQPDAPQEVRQRRDAALDAFSQSLDVLDAKAEWTEAGGRYFAELRACEAELTSSL